MKKNKGFTLIEVLIALAILSIALTAIIKATSQNIKDNMYLQNKIIANWVATDVINQARVDLIKLPIAPGELEKETVMLNRKWLWKGYSENTPNNHIKKLIVKIYLPESDSEIFQLESFLYAPS